MPRIRRYYPASHMLNRDPEFIQLRRQFADWMGYVWHEMIAWGDHTEGELKGKPETIAESLSAVSLTNRPSLARKCIINAFQYMQECGWIRIETDRILILNHAKYHKSRDDIKSQEGNNKIPPTEQPTNQPIKIEDTNVSSCALPFSAVAKAPHENGNHAAPPRHPIVALNGDWPSVQSLVALYNEQSPNECPAVSTISEERTKKGRRYLRLFPERQFWEQTFSNMCRSPFLRGLKPSPGHDAFIADFDWLLTKGRDGTENVVKVHDGRYSRDH